MNSPAYFVSFVSEKEHNISHRYHFGGHLLILDTKAALTLLNKYKLWNIHVATSTNSNEDKLAKPSRIKFGTSYDN